MCVSVLLLLFSHSVVSASLRLHGLQYARLPCPSPSPGVCSNSCLLSRWCHPTISSSNQLLDFFFSFLHFPVNPPTNAGDLRDACSFPGEGHVKKIIWRRAWQPTPVFLPGESHGQKEPGRLQSMGLQRVWHD